MLFRSLLNVAELTQYADSFVFGLELLHQLRRGFSQDSRWRTCERQVVPKAFWQGGSENAFCVFLIKRKSLADELV